MCIDSEKIKVVNLDEFIRKLESLLDQVTNEERQKILTLLAHAALCLSV